jgi:hypothetical protein
MIGYSDESSYKSEEVEAWKWMAIDEVKWHAVPSEIYTVWFKIIFDEFYHFWKIIKFKNVLQDVLDMQNPFVTLKEAMVKIINNYEGNYK